MSLPQREGRPSLDLKPEESTSLSKDWSDPIGAQYCQNDYDDLGANDLNNPTDPRKGGLAPNGWTREPYSVYPTDSQGVQTPDRAK